MEFRILGPLEVVDDGESFALGAVGQRALLAVLLLHRGEVVSLDRLIDELWGERAPATAAKTVQVYVSHLRKVLGSGVIVTEGRGYRLAVEPEQVDAGRFELLSAEGRRALAEGDAARASERLCSALALWRGDPFADFAYDAFAQSAISRLQEARLAAVEDRIEADLAAGRDGELIGELESLVASNPLQERLRGQLMLALYRAGRQADALAVYRQTSELLREELALEPGRSLRELERSILEHDPALESSQARARLVGVCPFKGLSSFDRADAEFFCGRERLVSDLLARLVESPLVGILGPSGIGKSSLLRAGVLAPLSAGVLPGSADWRQLLLRPGEHPRAELQHALGGGQLTGVLGRLSSGERIVVGVDQLEELFTLCKSEDERAAFLEQLAAAARDPERRALVIASLRADFYGRLASYPRFAELLSASHVLVGPMDREELARAIEQPAVRAGLEVEPALVDALVSDVAGEPGGLPLLSTTLLELWRTHDGRALRYASYRISGGVRGAVARLAEDAYNGLGNAEQRIARAVMLRLAAGEDGSLVRRRVQRGELERLPGAELVVAALTDARLLTVSDGEVELSHEALLREWPRYRTWLEEDQAGRRLHTHLMSSAREWEAAGRDPSELYRGARLTGVVEWAAQHEDELSALESEFIQSSRIEAERRTRRLRSLLLGVGGLLIIAVIAGVIAFIKQQSASNEARVALARQLGAEAVNEPRVDLAMLLAREAVNLDRSPQTEGALLGTLLRSPAVIGTLALPVNAPPQRLAVSPDGGALVVGDRSGPAGNLSDKEFYNQPGLSIGDVRLYDLRTHVALRRPVTDFSGGLAPVFSSDGSLLLYLTTNRPSDEEGIVVRDAHTLALRQRLAFDPLLLAHDDPDIEHAAVLIAPDGHTVYCAYSVFDRAGNPGSAYVDRWSLPDGRRLSMTRVGSGGLLAARLVQDGARLILVRPRDVTILETRSPAHARSIDISATVSAPTAAAISPDGRTIVTGSQTGRVTFINVSNGLAHLGVGGHDATVTNAAYQPGGQTVVTTGADGKVIVWDPHTATPLETLNGPAAQANGAAISADGTTLYTTSLDGVVLAWDLAGDRRFGRRAHLGPGLACCGPVSPLAPPLAMSPDASRFAVRLGASMVGLFSTSTLRQEATFSPGPKTITALAWSPDGHWLAVGGYSGLLQLWNIAGAPRLMRSFAGFQPILGQPEAVQSIAFSPDGRLIAATADSVALTGPGEFIHFVDNRLANVAVWRAGNGQLTVPPVNLGTGTSGTSDVIAFSRNGKLLAVSLLYGPDQLLDPSTGKVRRTLRRLGGNTTVSLAFSRDSILATGTQGGIVQLWNPYSGEQVAGATAVAAVPVTGIAFDPTGQRFATTGGQDGTVKLWFAPTLRQEGTALATEQGAAATAAFEPNGTNLLVVDDHGDAFTWPMSLAAWEQHACAIAGRNLTRKEWARFVTGRSYSTVCP